MIPRLAVETFVIAVLYIITGKLGLLLAIPPGNVTAVWPPSGIALAAVLLLGNRASLGIWLGSFLLNSWFFLSQTNPLDIVAFATSTGIGAGSTLQALLGAVLIKRLVPSGYPLDRPQSIFKFVGIELFSCMVASTAGITSLCLAGFTPWPNYLYTWRTWWTGDVTGIIIVTPLILSWVKPFSTGWKSIRAVELILFFLLLAVTGWFVFRQQPYLGTTAYSLEYMLLPFVLWAAIRFGLRGVTLATLVTSGVAIWGTSKGCGPFASAELNESLLQVQAFVAIVAITGLALATAIWKNGDERI